ncbi:MAG: CHAP domain-containing protein [Anaerolineae bacterium]|nr:CHAP domain-containing protein [Anaerolineae bacterium]MDQ7037249.1 CHAP domain-containing protein [Anaerolineae bacterium]
MTEIYVHLQSMRESADKMRQSTRTLQISASSVRALYVTLPVDIQTAIISEIGYTPNFDATNWLDMLIDFSQKLDNAANDIEDATQSELALEKDTPYFASGMVFGDLLPRILSNNDELFQPPEPVSAPIEPDRYVSQFNRPVYVELVNSQDNLRGEQEHLASLQTLRAEKMSDLAALENRMATAGVDNIEMQPRVQALQSEIDRIDQDIRSTENNINVIETRISELDDKLARVAPGPGADIDLIRSLENSETIVGIEQNTYDCVKFIVNRMTIPPGIANNAYLWDDNAAERLEYGITTGDAPLPGSVIVLEREHEWADDRYGHLMYVERVENGEVWVTDQYNPEVAVRFSDVTSETSGENVKYLYFPWETRAI